jgi:hypothetical protein
MTDFVTRYFKQESEALDWLGNRKRHADLHAYEDVLKLANGIAFFANSNNQKCAKVLLDQARTIKELRQDSADYMSTASETYASERHHAEQMRDQCGGY